MQRFSLPLYLDGILLVEAEVAVREQEERDLRELLEVPGDGREVELRLASRAPGADRDALDGVELVRVGVAEQQPPALLLHLFDVPQGCRV